LIKKKSKNPALKEKMIKIGNILFLILMMAQAAFADVSVKSELYPEDVAVGDQARVILTITSSEDFELQNPDFPQVDGIKILQVQNGGKSSSSRMSIVNGKTDFSKSIIQHYEYIIEFTKKGFVNIPSISVNVSGTVSASAPIKVSVSSRGEGAQGQARPRGRQRQVEEDTGIDDDMFSQLMKQRQRILEEVQNGGRGGGFGGANPFADPQEVPNLKLNNVNTNESFFVYAETDKTTAYEGEQITTNWYIYVKGVVEAIDRAKFPDLRGFWKEIIEEVPGLSFSPVIVNGIQYKRAMLASHALFPIKAGTVVIDEFKIKAKIRNQTEFGWGQPHEYTKASRRMPITVLPLPLEGKPMSFSGAVGQFQIQTQVDGLQVKAGQPFTLKVRLEGQGNAKLIELPPIEWPLSLTVFDTKSESKFFKNGQSYKEFEILLIPNQEGPFKIPLITFSYFDPQQKKYVTKTTEELQLTAIKSDQPLAVLSKSASGDLSAAHKAPVELSPSLEWPGSFSWMAERNLFFSLTALLCIVFLAIQFGLQYTKLTGRPSLQVKVSEKIRKIDLAMKAQNIKNVGSESVNLVYLILDGLNTEAGHKKTLDSQDITERLAQLPLHYKEKYEIRLNEIFNYFQMIGFAPDEVRNNLTRQKNIDQELADLKSISKEIADDLGRST
jgi:BatD DUF11 like domain